MPSKLKISPFPLTCSSLLGISVPIPALSDVILAPTFIFFSIPIPPSTIKPPDEVSVLSVVFFIIKGLSILKVPLPFDSTLISTLIVEIIFLTFKLLVTVKLLPVIVVPVIARAVVLPIIILFIVPAVISPDEGPVILATLAIVELLKS